MGRQPLSLPHRSTRPSFVFDAGFESDTVQTADQLNFLSPETLVAVFDLTSAAVSA
jgi:hypothetical protein